jgi:glycerol-3-phosphate dehydrogenase
MSSAVAREDEASCDLLMVEREVEYLVAHEWAREADDILLHRTKLALHGGPQLVRAVEK